MSASPLSDETHLQAFLSVVELVLVRGFNEVAVVTAFLQLHHDVEEAGRASFSSFTQGFIVPRQYPPKQFNRLNNFISWIFGYK